jgi:thioredoxin-related protein
MTGVWALTALLGLLGSTPDLADTGLDARTRQLPILLYVSRSDCSFCRRLEADVLLPLLRSEVLQGRILVRELVLDEPGNVRDFDGQFAAPAQIAERYGGGLTPTLLFLDASGEPLRRPIVGYSGSEYFSYYLEQAVAESAAIVDARRHSEEASRTTADNLP